MPARKRITVAHERLSIRFKPKLWQMLEDAAALEGVGKTDIVRRAVSAYLPQVFQRHTTTRYQEAVEMAQTEREKSLATPQDLRDISFTEPEVEDPTSQGLELSRF